MTSSSARVLLRAIVPLCLILVNLPVVGCSGGEDHAAGGSAEPSSQQPAFMQSAQRDLPKTVVFALGEFGRTVQKDPATFKGWPISFPDHVGRIWVVRAPGAICLVGGPDSESSVACFPPEFVSRGRGYTLLLGGPQDRRGVLVFGLKPPQLKDVGLIGGRSARCTVRNDVFVCRGIGASHIEYSGGGIIQEPLPEPQ